MLYVYDNHYCFSFSLQKILRQCLRIKLVAVVVVVVLIVVVV